MIQTIYAVAACLIVFGGVAVHAETFSGKVVRVSDGDTVTVLFEEKTPIRVRIMGIDAPEKKQAFGERSKQAMLDCIRQDCCRGMA